MSEDRDDIIILIDENGNEVEAEYIDTIEYNGNEYVVLLPSDGHDHAHDHGNGGGQTHTHDHADGECDCEEEEVVILKVEQSPDSDEESFVAIEDESEQDAVFAIFTQRMEAAEYDEDDFDEDDDE